MEGIDAIKKRRSVRRFTGEPVSLETLAGLVEAARLAPSAANLQPLKYVAVNEPVLTGEVFNCLAWAAYLKDGAPPRGEEPGAYIVVLHDTSIAKGVAAYDAGAAVENMLLSAVAEGLGGCWLGSIKKEELRGILDIPPHLEICAVVALGEPKEFPEAVEMAGDDHRYFRNEAGRHFVPKRPLEEIFYVGAYGKRYTGREEG